MDDFRVREWMVNMIAPQANSVRSFWTWLKRYAEDKREGEEESVEVKLTQKDMGVLSGVDNVGGCMSFLRDEGVVKTMGRGKYLVWPSDKEIDYADANKNREDKMERLQEVVRFLKDKKSCRVAYLCDYFGDISFVGPCNNCDNCT